MERKNGLSYLGRKHHIHLLVPTLPALYGWWKNSLFGIFMDQRFARDMKNWWCHNLPPWCYQVGILLFFTYHYFTYYMIKIAHHDRPWCDYCFWPALPTPSAVTGELWSHCCTSSYFGWWLAKHVIRITSIERLQTMTIDDIKKEIQMIMWAHYEVDVCRKDFVLLLDTLRTAANDDSQNQLVKVDHCDSVATVLRQWEMPCGTAAEGVRIRFDPCWKNYVQLTSCTWRPFARPLRHQWKIKVWQGAWLCVIITTVKTTK